MRTELIIAGLISLLMLGYAGFARRLPQSSGDRHVFDAPSARQNSDWSAKSKKVYCLVPTSGVATRYVGDAPTIDPPDIDWLSKTFMDHAVLVSSGPRYVFDALAARQNLDWESLKAIWTPVIVMAGLQFVVLVSLAIRFRNRFG